MNNEAVFSVAIINYNQYQTLFHTFDSVLDQKYPAIQLILCDNESCDFDKDAVQDYLNKKKRENIVDVVLYRQEVHCSDAAIAQKAFELVTGEFFKLLRGGDMLVPGALTRVVKAMSRGQKQAVALVGKYVSCPGNARYFPEALKKNKTDLLKCKDGATLILRRKGEEELDEEKTADWDEPDEDDDAVAEKAENKKRKATEKERSEEPPAPSVKGKTIAGEIQPPDVYFFADSKPSERALQYCTMNCGAYSYEPLVFWRTKTLREVGGYSAVYRYIIEWPAFLKLCFRKEKLCYSNDVFQYVRAENSSDWWVPMSKALGRPKLIECADMLKDLAEPYLATCAPEDQRDMLLRECQIRQDTLRIWETIQCQWDEMTISSKIRLKIKYRKSLFPLWLHSWNARKSLRTDLMWLFNSLILFFLDHGVFNGGLFTVLTGTLLCLSILSAVFHCSLVFIRKWRKFCVGRRKQCIKQS